jgi:hypothetical protein
MKPVESATQAEADFTKEFLAGYFGQSERSGILM